MKRTIPRGKRPVQGLAFILLILLSSPFLLTRCGGSRGNDKAAERISEVMDIKQDVVLSEQGFLLSLDSLNLLRGDTAFSQAALEGRVSSLTGTYNYYVQAIYDALGKAAALANNQTCPSVDALSEYLLGMKSLAETNYSEMMRLSSLPLDTYSGADSTAYAMAVSRAERQRDNLERALEFEVQRFAKEHGVDLSDGGQD